MQYRCNDQIISIGEITGNDKRTRKRTLVSYSILVCIILLEENVIFVIYVKNLHTYIVMFGIGNFEK